MRQSMLHAFSQQQLHMDEMFNKAIEEACDPVRIQRLISKQAEECLHNCIQSEIKDFFSYGEGRKIVKAQVLKMLSKEIESE